MGITIIFAAILKIIQIMNSIYLLSFLILLSFVTIAQETQKKDAIKNDKIFELGEVSLYYQSPKEVLHQEIWEQTHKNDLAQSLNMLPSLVLSHTGSRNESSVYMRGFEIRSIPVYMDGIPVYVPYDGYMDLSRFTTADLSKIEVSKGYSSIMYGPNALAGTINMISTQPKASIELSAKAGMLSGNGFDNYVSIGTKQAKYYAQAVISQYDRSYLPLSENFKSDREDDNKLNNSYRFDRKYRFKIGFTPNEQDAYVMNYNIYRGEKGNPVYQGEDPDIRLRYWQWPYWDKESVYFISKTQIGSSLHLKTRWFYDTFKNKLSSYDDASFTTQNRGYAFNSFYNDKTYGANTELSSQFGAHTLKAALHYKWDHHTANNEGALPENIKDATYTAGIEDVWKTQQNLKLIPGISYSLRKGITADNTNIILEDGSYERFENLDVDAFNFQIAGLYQTNSKAHWHASVSYKTKFPSMKERFSYRLDVAIPNPDLEPEKSFNIDLGLNYQLNNKFSIKPEIFYSHLLNSIQQVDNVTPGIWQMQNTGEADFYGLDMALSYKPFQKLEALLNYSFVERKNKTNPDIQYIDVPKHHLITAINWTPVINLQLNLNGEWASERYSTSDGLISTRFNVWHARGAYDFSNGLSIEGGVQNIFDTNYTISEGFPEAGRNFFVSLQYAFVKK